MESGKDQKLPKSSVYINGSNTNSTMEAESGELSSNMIGVVVTIAILFCGGLLLFLIMYGYKRLFTKKVFLQSEKEDSVIELYPIEITGFENNGYMA